jgi:nitroimidazol reductase NimA-like FMN-containing flavoprotein (pyridoxamine 5'-phosphate oxidase superfamily)
MPDEIRPAELRELDRASCLALLASQRVGRLVLPGDVPFVAPVNYTVVDEALHFRTDAESRASRTHGTKVVFEVDAVDEPHHAGERDRARHSGRCDCVRFDGS